MSLPELKHCPFCGEQPEVTKHFKRDEYCLVHRCQYIPAHIDFTTMAGILKRWNTRSEPAIPMHQPVRCAKRAVEALEGLLAIVSDSFGVAGYHLNGEVAEWGELEEVAAAEEALAAYRTQDDEIPMHPCIMQLDKMGDV